MVERKVLSREVLEACLQRETDEGKPLAVLLVSEGVVSEKDRLEYQGYVATMREADAIFEKAERYGRWVEEMLTGTRASD